MTTNTVRSTTIPMLPALRPETVPAVVALLDELADAVTRRDSNKAARVVDLLYTVAGPAWTDATVAHLMACALRRIAVRGGR